MNRTFFCNSPAKRSKRLSADQTTKYSRLLSNLFWDLRVIGKIALDFSKTFCRLQSPQKCLWDEEGITQW
jgi:hypothetical protein